MADTPLIQSGRRVFLLADTATALLAVIRDLTTVIADTYPQLPEEEIEKVDARVRHIGKRLDGIITNMDSVMRDLPEGRKLDAPE